jgi:hypothetical protein
LLIAGVAKKTRPPLGSYSRIDDFGAPVIGEGPRRRARRYIYPWLSGSLNQDPANFLRISSTSGNIDPVKAAHDCGSVDEAQFIHCRFERNTAGEDQGCRPRP